MIRPPPRSTRTDTLFPYTTLFRSTIRAGDVSRLTKLPGVGRKTPERLVIAMRDKAGAEGETGAGIRLAVDGSALGEAKSALAALGYKPAEIQRFTAAVYKDGQSTQPILQETLKRAVQRQEERRVGNEGVSTSI